jgi:polyphosphate:AMP phosphotransferase
MFEAAELKNKLPKAEYEQAVADLRTRLLDVQQRLEAAKLPVTLIVAGLDCAGKGDLLGKLNEWLDPRFMRTHAFGAPSEEEMERPRHWRYWMSLPPRGHIGLYAMGWYAAPLSERMRGEIGTAKLDAELAHIRRLEKMLSDDGALVLKCWLHLSKKQQRQVIDKLSDDPETAWQVGKVEEKHFKQYDQFIAIAEHTLRETSTPEAPWLIINAYDPHYRRITIANWIISSIAARLDALAQAEPRPLEPAPPVTIGRDILGALDLGAKLDKPDYQKQLARYQGKLSRLAREARQDKRSAILLFEGWDAAGKGGTIRRITQALDARNYRVIPIAAPTDEEKAQHYLWRFWRHLPRGGSVTIYDRSWYGRVLVERVEGFAQPQEWRRAYSEINDFEEELAGHGVILLKFWMHIDQDEQMRRFKEREKTSYKRYKITEEDYRNRDRWDRYVEAVNEMVTRTSTEYAPWHLVSAQDKYSGRIQVLKRVCEAYQRALD